MKWIHPALATGEVDWDQALVEALPKVQAADTPEAFRQALGTLMAPLHDPAFRIGDAPTPLLVQAPEGQASVEWMPGDIALVHLHHGNVSPWDPGHAAFVKAVDEAILKAKGLIFDLRPAAGGGGRSAFDDYFRKLVPRLIEASVQLPGERYRHFSGFKPQRGSTSGGYFSGQIIVAAERMSPAKGAHVVPMVFIVNEGSEVPKVALALQHAGKAWILAEGRPSAAWVTPGIIETLDDGTKVTFSTGELLFADGTVGFGADGVLEASSATGPETGVSKAAEALLRGGTHPGAAQGGQAVSALPVEAPDSAYPDLAFPTLPWRQLAVIKFWGTMDAFFPYLQLTDRPWRDTLPLFLARMEQVKDGQEYALALAEMSTGLQDSHVSVYGPQLRAFYGEAQAGLYLAEVEGRVVITGFRDEALKAEAGLRVGDVLLRVDGEDVQARIHRLCQVLTGSNRNGQVQKALLVLLKGPEGSRITVEIEGAEGRRRELSLLRSKAYKRNARPLRPGPTFKVLPGNIGYADLDRLEIEDVPAMVQALKGTNALIFDMRGYPHGTAWTLAPWLNVKGAKVGASIQQNLHSVMSGEGSRLALDQPIPVSSSISAEPRYQGKVVMLINQETMSQAEHTGLFFEAACGATFIGTPSAGANGDVTNLVLPGDVEVSFSGSDICHADGRQLQRVGLQPHLRVAPTVKGLQEGRDEVLERAERFLIQGK